MCVSHYYIHLDALCCGLDFGFFASHKLLDTLLPIFSITLISSGLYKNNYTHIWVENKNTPHFIKDA